jgi:hypothetical protein
VSEAKITSAPHADVEELKR